MAQGPFLTRARRVVSVRAAVSAFSLALVSLVFFSSLRELFEPLFRNLRAYGFHDWDAHSAYRYISVISLKRFHEMPWWHPYFCGGFPAWAYVEGATNVVSPYLLAYLTLPVQAAERVELLGSAITGLLGTYLLAGRFTRSAALRAFAAVAYGINGRFALQASTGHTWHLQYGWVPLALYFLDRSCEPGRLRSAFYGGVIVALMVYMGGIYPLPHAGLLLVVYAGVLAISRRKFLPIGAVSLLGLSGIGLSAPKLFPLIDLMIRHPRKIDSPEYIDLGQLVTMMTEPNQSYMQAPVVVPRWGWHEYGIYVGWVVFFVMFVGLSFGARGRGLALRVTGAFFLALGMGSFHKFSPWKLLHDLPVFSSQHVPSRFLHPAVLLLTLSGIVVLARWVDGWVSSKPWLDWVMLAGVLWVGVDIAKVGRKSTEHVFYMDAPALEFGATFEHGLTPPANYTPADWGGATLLAMFSNRGVLNCYGVPDSIERGAIAKGQPGYKGEAYFAEGPGKAEVVSWSVNHATVRFEGARPGDLLVYNMNFDPSWRANGTSATDYLHAVASPVVGAAGEVRFAYAPRMLPAGLLCLVVVLVGWFGFPAFSRFRQRRATA